MCLRLTLPLTTRPSHPSSSSAKQRPGRHVRFAATTRVRVHALTLQATADNACHWSLDWAHAAQEVHEAVRFDDDDDDNDNTAFIGRRPLRRFSLHQREKRLAAVTGWSLDRVYQQEEEALLRQIEQMVKLRCDSVDKSSDSNNNKSSSNSSGRRPSQCVCGMTSRCAGSDCAIATHTTH